MRVCVNTCINLHTYLDMCVKVRGQLGELVVSSLMWVSEMEPIIKVIRLGESVLTHGGITLTINFFLFLQFQTDDTMSLIVF